MATQYIGTGRLGTHQSVAYTDSAGTIANATNTGVYKVRVYATTAAYIKIDNSPTATASDVPIAGATPEYFTITPGQKVSALRVTTNGSLHVTEVT